MALLLATASPCAADDITLDALPVLRVAPGMEADMTLRIQGSHSLDATLIIGNAASGEYATIGAPDAGCASLSPLSGIRHVLFDPTAANGDLSCHYRIARDVASINDLDFSMYANGSNGLPIAVLRVVIGTTADLGLDASPANFELLPDGRARGVVTVTLRNRSTVPVEGATAGYCFDNSFPEFSIDGQIASGCGAQDGYSGICFDSPRYGFALPRTEPGGAWRCRVELVSNAAYVQPLSYPIQLDTQFVVDSDNGGRLINVLAQSPHELMLTADALFAAGFE